MNACCATRTGEASQFGGKIGYDREKLEYTFEENLFANVYLICK